MTQRVTLNIENHVAQVRLNRADKYNGLDMDMIEGLVETAETIKTDPTIRAVVLSGNGPSFCAGLDVAGVMSNPSNIQKLLQTEEGHDANLVQRCALDWKDLPVPVIAALHGHVYGGGFQIAMGADIRIAKADTVFSIMEMKWGLIPDMSLSVTVPEFARQDIIKELTYTGRKFGSEEAKEYGLITRIADNPLESATALAHEIVGKSPDAIRGAKRMLNSNWRAGRAEALKLEETIQKSIIGRPNQMEAVQANFQKREPNFKDPKN